MRVGVNTGILRAAEGPLAERFETDVADELKALGDACALLVFMVTQRGAISVEVPMEEGEEAPKPGEFNAVLQRAAPALRLHAQTVICAKGLRQIRAARAVLRIGYEWETAGFVRALVELIEHRQAIIKDETGRYAHRWLISRQSAKIAQQSGDLYANLSADSHGDAATITRLFDPADNAIEVAPRRTHRTRATLLMLAGFARDQAVVIAGFTGVELGGLDQISAGWEKLRAEFDGATDT
jgi:hypothetical protein